MRRYGGHLLAALLIVAIVTGGLATPAGAQGNLIISAIKLFGIGYVVKTFGPQINDFINKLMLNNKVQNTQMTKVVPVVSVRLGVESPGRAAIGAAQVQGPKAAVDKVQAVAQIEGTFSDVVEVRALIPVDSLNPIPGNMHRVQGVGLTALIDFKL